jgi:hypothetical protein
MILDSGFSKGVWSRKAWNALRIESKGRDCADAAKIRQILAVGYSKRFVGFMVYGERGSESGIALREILWGSECRDVITVAKTIA